MFDDMIDSLKFISILGSSLYSIAILHDMPNYEFI